MPIADWLTVFRTSAMPQLPVMLEKRELPETIARRKPLGQIQQNVQLIWARRIIHQRREMIEHLAQCYVADAPGMDHFRGTVDAINNRHMVQTFLSVLQRQSTGKISPNGVALTPYPFAAGNYPFR
jgi:hypothetical protein